MKSIFKYYNPSIHFDYGEGNNSINDKNKMLNYLKRYHIITEFTCSGISKDEQSDFQNDESAEYLTPLSQYLNKHGINVSSVLSNQYSYEIIRGLYDTNYFKNGDKGRKKAIYIMNKIVAWHDNKKIDK